MDIFDKTAFYKQELINVSCAALITIFDGMTEPKEVDLLSFQKNTISFGRDDNNDITFKSRYVSRQHGYFILKNNTCLIENNPTNTNGIIYNNKIINKRIMEEGDSIRIDDGIETTAEGVLIIFSFRNDAKWKSLAISNSTEIKIGRNSGCNIQLNHISVSNLHATIKRKDGIYWLYDNDSKNGVSVNGKKVNKKVILSEKDLILITNTKIIFSHYMISYCCSNNGISVDGYKIVKSIGKNKIICNNVSLTIKPCELIAIIGGSGAGKTTIMNCLSGYNQPTAGTVRINGINLYENYDALKNIIGYVPQSDIIYDNLTVYSMLLYTAKLRLPSDLPDNEIEEKIIEILNIVELTDRKFLYIKELSGGQKKRVSIAVELLSDPFLLYLDEPASGLDPGTERNLMITLKKMTQIGKTVIFVTHSILNLHMCDKILFMGCGGYVCYYGSYDEAKSFFGVNDVTDIYGLLSADPITWHNKYLKQCTYNEQESYHSIRLKKHTAGNWFNQTFILCKRHLHIMINDRIRTIMLLLQAPFLALLIYFVADGTQFTYPNYYTTKGLLFALSCSAFWVGLLNTIQEVCKERHILKREYMTGLRLSAYITSKSFIIVVICIIQSFLSISVFSLLVGLPDSSVIFSPFLELYITTLITAISAASMGLFISSLFKNADRVMTVAPIVLIPQILFSGIIFNLDGSSKLVSYITVCRWSMEGYGSTADLNNLNMMVIEMGEAIDKTFEVSIKHLTHTWAILFGFAILFIIIAYYILRNLNLNNR